MSESRNRGHAFTECCIRKFRWEFSATTVKMHDLYMALSTL